MRGHGLSPVCIKEITSLRQRGYSLPEISFEVSVPKTTVFRHIRGVEILPEYKKDWLGKRGGSIKRKLMRDRQALNEASKFLVDLTAREKLIFLSALYWGEGTKNDFSFSNGDPTLVKTFVTLIKQSLLVPNDRIRLGLRIYSDLNTRSVKEFWLKLLDMPESSITSIETLEGKKSGKLLYGMCRVRVLKGGDLLKKIKATYNVIAERCPYSLNG